MELLIDMLVLHKVRILQRRQTEVYEIAQCLASGLRLDTIGQIFSAHGRLLNAANEDIDDKSAVLFLYLGDLHI